MVKQSELNTVQVVLFVEGETDERIGCSAIRKAFVVF